jgi:hypothetical protein
MILMLLVLKEDLEVQCILLISEGNPGGSSGGEKGPFSSLMWLGDERHLLKDQRHFRRREYIFRR